MTKEFITFEEFLNEAISSKENFVKVAAILKKYLNTLGKSSEYKNLISDFIAMYKAENPNFKEETFKQAILKK